MGEANKSSYKLLVSRSGARKAKKSEFKQRFNSTLDKLFPRTQPAPNQESKNYDALVKNLENSYADKLSRQAKESQLRQSEAEKKANKAINNLSQQVSQGQAQYKGLSEGVQKALDKIYADKAKASQKANEKAAEKTTQEATPRELPKTLDNTYYRDLDKAVPKKVVTKEVVKEEEPVKEIVKEAPVTEVVKATLKLKQHVPIGDAGYTYKVTNLYGPRTGANFVPGRPEGEHSRGVDVTSHDWEGRKSNVPISIADGKVINVWKQGSGRPIGTKQGIAGGYVMDVLSPNGKVITYAHLGPSIYENRDKYIGRELKRGEVISDDTRWSGSGTEAHVKVFMSDSDKAGRPKRNYTENGNDPTQLILSGKYL